MPVTENEVPLSVSAVVPVPLNSSIDTAVSTLIGPALLAVTPKSPFGTHGSPSIHCQLFGLLHVLPPPFQDAKFCADAGEINTSGASSVVPLSHGATTRDTRQDSFFTVSSCAVHAGAPLRPHP